MSCVDCYLRCKKKFCIEENYISFVANLGLYVGLISRGCVLWYGCIVIVVFIFLPYLFCCFSIFLLSPLFFSTVGQEILFFILNVNTFCNNYVDSNKEESVEFYVRWLVFILSKYIKILWCMYLNCICIIEKNIFGESIGSQYWNEMDCVCVSKRQCVFVCGRIFYLKCPSGSSQVVVIVTCTCWNHYNLYIER